MIIPTNLMRGHVAFVMISERSSDKLLVACCSCWSSEGRAKCRMEMKIDRGGCEDVQN